MLEFSERPWGTYQVLHTTAISQVKEITVKAGARLSYQTHQKRAEHWFIVAGHGEVTLDGVVQKVAPGDEVSFGIGVAHRVHNTGTEELIFVEVQTGTYFGEDDIVRIEDDYGRWCPLKVIVQSFTFHQQRIG